jgi:hypothetical protein
MSAAGDILYEAFLVRFGEWKRARSKREKRFLMDRMLVENIGLVKRLTAQVCGISEDGTPPTPMRRGGAGGFPRIRVHGVEDVPWEDLLQAGLLGMEDAIERFDPSKGRISGYARIRILNSVQTVMRQQPAHLTKAPKGKEAMRPTVALLDDQQVLDRLAGADVDQFDDDEPWKGCQSVEEARARKEALDRERALWASWERPAGHPPSAPVSRARVYSVPRPPIVCFIEARCTRGRGRRQAVWPLWSRWSNDRIACGENPGTRQDFIAALVGQGMREVASVRTAPRTSDSKGSWSRGLAGLVLVAA